MSTPVTRDQLLASVHELRPGDLLVLRLPEQTPADRLDAIRRLVGAELGDSGVRVLVMHEHIPLEHYRQTDEAIAAEIERELRKRERARGGRS